MENNFKDCKFCGGKIRWIKVRGKERNEPCEIAGSQGMTQDGELVTVFQLHWGNCMKNRNKKA